MVGTTDLGYLKTKEYGKDKVENTEISVVNVQNEDYISLTDMAHSQMQEHIIF